MTDEAIKLIDFGFAIVSKPEESLKLLCGTPAYMSPEMLLKKEYRGPPIDIWTCGVVFYALLTGGLPFTAHTERDLHKKITSGIFHVPKEISPRAHRLLSWMLTVDPSKRATADEISKELSDVSVTSSKQGSESEEQFEAHLRGRGADIPRQVDQATLAHMLKLGYNESEIRAKCHDENDMVGKLYQRLLVLKK